MDKRIDFVDKYVKDNKKSPTLTYIEDKFPTPAKYNLNNSIMTAISKDIELPIGEEQNKDIALNRAIDGVRLLCGASGCRPLSEEEELSLK